MNGTLLRRRTDPTARAHTRPRRRAISERQLTTISGTALWFSTTAVVMIASFVEQVAPANVDFWRLALGVPAVCFGIANAVIGPRLRDDHFQLLVELNLIPALAINLVLLQITPASETILFNMIAPLIFAGYFLRLPALAFTLLAGVAIALSTLFTDPAAQTPHLASFLVVYVTTIVVTTALLHLQNAETLGALAQTQRRGRTDPLTGLANSHALHRAAKRMLTTQTSKRGPKLVPGLLLIDLDNFKSANSKHGHLGGDYALRMIAQQMLRVAPKGSVVARVGGDEFAVLLTADSRARIDEAGEIFRAAVRAAGSIMELEGVEIDAAVGSAAFPEDGRDLSELLDIADKAMYEMKGEKRHTVPNFEHRRASEARRPAWIEESAAIEQSHENQALTLDDVAGGRIARLAGRTAYARTSAIAWGIGSVVLAISLLMPDAYPDPTLTWWMVLIGGFALTPLILLLNAKPQSPTHLALDVASLLALAAVIALTGGIASAAAPLLILLVASQAWFWQTRLVAFRLIGPLLVTVSPLIYTSLGSSQEDVIELMTLYGLAAVVLTLVSAMYFDRVILARLQRRAERLAATDPLTGIANRRTFDSYVQATIDSEQHEQFAIVMIDLDNFKQVNTNRGHRAGDEVLREIAASLAAVARTDDCVARVGGDEFAAVLPGVGVDGARQLAERLVGAVAETPSAKENGVSASAGFALSPLHGESLDHLLFTADNALMAVKASGKGNARVARLVSAVN